MFLRLIVVAHESNSDSNRFRMLCSTDLSGWRTFCEYEAEEGKVRGFVSTDTLSIEWCSFSAFTIRCHDKTVPGLFR